MRFKRYERYNLPWNSRRGAAYLAKCRRERNALPLFAEQIGEEQISVEEERLRRERENQERETASRKEHAASWRKARRLLAELPYGREITREWNHHRWLPGQPWYLLTLIEMRRRERLAEETAGVTSAAQGRTDR